MAIQVDWDTPNKTVILITRQEPWTWQEFRHAVQTVLEMLDSVSHPVYVIDDLYDNAFMPAGGLIENTLWAVENYRLPANLDAVIFVTGSFSHDLFVSLMELCGAQERPYYFARTINEAQAIIAARRDS